MHTTRSKYARNCIHDPFILILCTHHRHTEHVLALAFTLITSSNTPISTTFPKSTKILSIGPLDSFRKHMKSLSAAIFCQIMVTSKSSCSANAGGWDFTESALCQYAYGTKQNRELGDAFHLPSAPAVGSAVCILTQSGSCRGDGARAVLVVRGCVSPLDPQTSLRQGGCKGNLGDCDCEGEAEAARIAKCGLTPKVAAWRWRNQHGEWKVSRIGGLVGRVGLVL